MRKAGGLLWTAALLIPKIWLENSRVVRGCFEGVIVNEICAVGLHGSLYAVGKFGPERIGGGGGKKFNHYSMDLPNKCTALEKEGIVTVFRAGRIRFSIGIFYQGETGA